MITKGRIKFGYHFWTIFVFLSFIRNEVEEAEHELLAYPLPNDKVCLHDVFRSITLLEFLSFDIMNNKT